VGNTFQTIKTISRTTINIKSSPSLSGSVVAVNSPIIGGPDYPNFQLIGIGGCKCIDQYLTKIVNSYSFTTIGGESEHINSGAEHSGIRTCRKRIGWGCCSTVVRSAQMPSCSCRTGGYF